MDKKRYYLEDEFLKKTGELAFLYNDKINPKYIKWLESELYALKQVKNNGVLDDVNTPLKDIVFELANKLATSGKGEQAVAMHVIHNSL